MDISPLQAHRVKAEDLPLDRLAANPHISEPEKIAALSHGFEAVLLQKVLQEAQRPVFKSKYASDSTTHGIYRDMVTDQLAESISKSNSLGLAQSLAAGLQRHSRAPSTPAPMAGGDGPPAPSAPAVLRSPKDAADRAVTAGAQGHVAAPQTPAADGGEPLSGRPAVRILASPKMKGVTDRIEERARTLRASATPAKGAVSPGSGTPPPGGSREAHPAPGAKTELHPPCPPNPIHHD
jgi:Rod binding domain-containing protein